MECIENEVLTPKQPILEVIISHLSLAHNFLLRNSETLFEKRKL